MGELVDNTVSEVGPDLLNVLSLKLAQSQSRSGRPVKKKRKKLKSHMTNPTL